MGRSKSKPNQSQDIGTSVLTQPGRRLEAQKAMAAPKESTIPTTTTRDSDQDDLVDTPPSTPKNNKRKRLNDLAQRHRGRHLRNDEAKMDDFLLSLFNASAKDGRSTRRKKKMAGKKKEKDG